MKNIATLIVSTLLGAACAFTAGAADKKIVLIAGPASHGAGEHEYRAGCLLWQKCLASVPGIQVMVYSNGCPQDASAFTGADAVVIFSDGGGGHPFLKGNGLQIIGDLMKKGVGLGCVHYAVEVPKEKAGPAFLDWIGGYFETYWSVNPFWLADFKTLPNHPVTRGVKPFQIRDEWYYHMRFPEGMKEVTPILSATPLDSTRGKPGVNSDHGGNPEVQKHAGEAEHVMWVFNRPDGGRGFGFTGGHSHNEWADENFRKVVLNAIVWVSGAEVPAAGVASQVTAEDLAANLDPKGRRQPQTNPAPKASL